VGLVVGAIVKPLVGKAVEFAKTEVGESVDVGASVNTVVEFSDAGDVG